MSLPADDWRDVVAEFAVLGGVTIERRGPGTANTMGEIVPATPTLIVLDPCSVVPVTGRRREPALVDRTREEIEVYACVEITAGDATRDADVVLWQGRRWKMTNVENYQPHGMVWMGVAELEEALA